jgi:hypothetical protein
MVLVAIDRTEGAGRMVLVATDRTEGAGRTEELEVNRIVGVSHTEEAAHIQAEVGIIVLPLVSHNHPFAEGGINPEEDIDLEEDIIPEAIRNHQFAEGDINPLAHQNPVQQQQNLQI